MKIPAYVLFCALKPNMPKRGVVDCVTSLVQYSIEKGGVVKGVRNNGVGPTPFIFEGVSSGEKYRDAQIVSIELFSRPSSIRDIVKELNRDPRVIRYTVLRADEALNPHINPASILPKKPEGNPLQDSAV